MAVPAMAQPASPPRLATVLDRAASYVDAFERQLTAIVADEQYEQAMGIRGRRGGEFIPTTRRTLTSRLALAREREQGYIEARDVIDVDGVPVSNRETTMAARIGADPSRWSVDDKMRLREESARYNIGDIVRTINTPLFALQVLQRANQRRFKFSHRPAGQPMPERPRDAVSGAFRIATDVWIVEFREQGAATMIRTEQGHDLPSRGRLWIDADSGRVMMTEIVVENRKLRAEVTVSFKSEPLLGLLPPVEMHERYRALDRSQTIIEASARYGPFHLIE